jgi:hypothetical protein
MKSKTLQLIERYHRLIKEQGEAGVPPQQPEDMNMSQDVTENPEPAPEEPLEVPLSPVAEYQYIKDVLMAAQMPPPDGEDKQKIIELLNMMDQPDVNTRIQGAGETANSFYQKEILPLIRGGQQNSKIRNLSDQIS